MDGAGGGGGCGFVNRTEVFDEELQFETRAAAVPERPAAPSIEFMDHRLIRLSWNPPKFGYSADPTSYIIEYAKGPSSSDFSEIHSSAGAGRIGYRGTVRDSDDSYVPQATQKSDSDSLHFTFSVPQGDGKDDRDQLQRSIFRFRVRATSRTFGSGFVSEATTVEVPKLPLNEWKRVVPRASMLAFSGGGRRLDNGPTGEFDLYPAARRGHSTVVIGGFMYLFGGWQEGYRCDTPFQNDHRFGLENLDPAFPTRPFCRRKRGASNELWRYDPVTLTWAQIRTQGEVPAPREMHSAVVNTVNPGSLYSGKMIIFGGHGGGNGTTKDGGPGGKEYLGDIWEMDPDRLTTTVVDGGGRGKPIKDGSNLFVSTFANVSSDLCVVDVDVEVNIKHACTRDLVIELLGPAHRHRGVGHRESQKRQHEFGQFEAGSESAEDPPQARDQRVLMFDGYDGTTSGCGVNLENLRFDDRANRTVDECCPSPFTGSFRPISPLDVYNDLQVRGEWSLRVYDKRINELHGNLTSWKIHLTMRPCEARYVWKNLTPLVSGPHGSPDPRYRHSAVVVEGSMYLWGGHSWARLSDIWRFQLDTNTWYKIDNIPYRAPERYGRASVISPWQVLYFGGYSHTKFVPFVWRYDPVHFKWERIDTFGTPGGPVTYTHRSTEEPAPTLFGEIMPVARTMASLAIIGLKNTPSRKRGIQRPQILMFGGYDGVSYLDDLWQLDLNLLGIYHDLSGSPEEERWNNECRWRLVKNSPEDNRWLSSCRSNGVGQGQVEKCAVDDILLRAWCTGEYQGFLNM